LFINRRGFHSTGPRSANGAQWREAVRTIQKQALHETKYPNIEEARKIQTKDNLEIKNNLKEKNLVTKENYFSLARKYPTYGHIQVECFHGKDFTMINNNDDAVVSSIVWLDGFENTSIAIWSVLSRNAQVILDVGSYTGLYSLVAGANNDSDITAFEPLSDNYTRLTENIKLNNFKIRALNMALSDSNGKAEFNVFSEPGFLTSGGSLLKGSNRVKRSEEVELGTIDTLGVFNIPELIKIDVEGAELSVLRGMQIVFDQGHRPDFLIEVLDEQAGATLTDFFEGMGYKFYQVFESNKKIIRKNSLTGTGNLNSLNNLITSKSMNELTTLLEPVNIDIES
jgi:FkbM family methyltransferase